MKKKRPASKAGAPKRRPRGSSRTIELLVLLDDFREQAHMLSPDLRVRLENEIERLLKKQSLWPPDRRHHIRAKFVNKHLARGKGIDEACDDASTELQEMRHPARAKGDMVKKSYYWVQHWVRARELPKR